jgi:hypothetical protein
MPGVTGHFNLRKKKFKIQNSTTKDTTLFSAPEGVSSLSWRREKEKKVEKIREKRKDFDRSSRITFSDADTIKGTGPVVPLI